MPGINPSAAWEAGHPWGSVYDFFVERESLARVAGRLAFGTDTRLLYRAIDSIGELPLAPDLAIPTARGTGASRDCALPSTMACWTMVVFRSAPVPTCFSPT